MYLLHRSVGPSVQFLYSGCMIAAKFRIMTIEQRAVRGTAENFVICDTQKSYSENLFRRLSEKLSGYFQFHVFHDIENLKIAAKSMQVNILLIGEEYGKEDRDEIPARQKYLLIGEKIPNEFNRGLNNRTAIYTPFAQAIPNVPVIDRENCLKFKTGKCGVCSKVCQAGAIDYDQQDEIVTQKYGAIVVATGFDTIKLDKYDEYAYSQSKDVITSLELERIMNAAGPTKGHLERLSDGKAPKELVFIQCVGSRCSDDRGKPYCSKICCMYTAKHAMLIRDKYPDTNVTVFYIDVRTPGKNFDEFYRRAVEQYGVNYIKGQVGKVIPQPDGSLLVQGSDLIDNKQILKKADMVVLATAIEPNPDVRKIATMLTASIDTNNFLTEAHAKLRPVESPTAGIFLSGVCQGPKDIPETVAQAGAAAVKAIGLLAKDKLTTNPCTAKSDELLCNGCSTCANVCPYGAISYEDKQVNDHGIRETRRVAVVNTALCQGCGACTVACPSGAMDLQGFSNRQIIAEVDAICR